MKTLLPLVCLLIIGGGHAISQTTQPYVVNVSGGSGTSENDCFEWSIGELSLVNDMTASDGKYILTNGFLQPFARNEHVVNIPERFLNYEVRLLPNPVKDVLGIQFLTGDYGKLRLAIYDERGSIKYYREVNVGGSPVVEYVNMISYASGNYLLRADFDNADKFKSKKTQSYKIVKIH
jgi:hypothetical protein